MKKLVAISSVIALFSYVSTASALGGPYIGPTLFAKYVSSSHSHYTGLNPRLSFGYGDLNDSVYLAFEITAAPFSMNLSNSHNSGAPNSKVEQEYGVSAIIGEPISDQFLAYLRLSGLVSKFPGPNKRSSGGQVGVGLQTCLTGHFDIRAEYNYTAFHSVSGLGSPKSQEIGVGFIYKFA